MISSLKVYGEWDDDKAQKRGKRAALDLTTLRRVLVKVHGTNGNDYLVRGHVALDQYKRWNAITARRDCKMQLHLGSSTTGYVEGESFFHPPAP